MPYALREHTADVAVEATGDDLGAVFAAVGDGLAAAQCEELPATGGDRFDLEERAERPQAALFEYLDRLIYERDVRNVLPVDNDATVERDGGTWVVTASARGVPLANVPAREVKAVTYSQMRLAREGDGWSAYVVFDV